MADVPGRARRLRYQTGALRLTAPHLPGLASRALPCERQHKQAGG
jgi:hypothetical protein